MILRSGNYSEHLKGGLQDLKGGLQDLFFNCESYDTYMMFQELEKPVEIEISKKGSALKKAVKGKV